MIEIYKSPWVTLTMTVLFILKHRLNEQYVCLLSLFTIFIVFSLILINVNINLKYLSSIFLPYPKSILQYLLFVIFFILCFFLGVLSSSSLFGDFFFSLELLSTLFRLPFESQSTSECACLYRVPLRTCLIYLILPSLFLNIVLSPTFID